MFPLVILAAVVAGSLAGCSRYQSPESLDATAEPPQVPPARQRSAATSFDGGRSDGAPVDSYSSQRTQRQQLESVRQGVGVLSNMCDWYNTDFEKSFCRTMFGFTDLYLQSEQNRVP